MRNRYRRSRGVALLTVLLVVSIATIIGVSLVKRQWLDIRKTENIQRMEQSWLYAHGVEAWASGRLRSDDEKNDVDSELDIWNQPIEPTKVEGGELSASVSDAQSKFNINNLMNADKNGIQLSRFRRLLTILDLPQELTDPLLDWLDADSEIHYPNGAEDNHYLGKDPAYRPANRAIADISELRLIEGYTKEIYRTLEPYVSALPGTVDINVNTAQEPVLRCLGKDLTQQDTQTIIDARSEQPFANMDDFLQHPALAGREIAAEGLAVSSRYFVVNSAIRTDRLKLGYRSILFRKDKDTIQVIQRVKRDFVDD